MLQWRSLWQIPSVAFHTLAGTALVMLGILAGRPPQWFHRRERCWAEAVLRLGPVRVLCEGAEHAAPGRAFVVVSNHRSHMDLPALITSLPLAFRALAKRELFSIPVFGWGLKALGHIAVERVRGLRRGGDPLHEARLALNRGVSILIFPEGARNREPAARPLQSFRGGAFRLAVEAGVPILPVAVLGGDKLMPVGALFVRAGLMTVRAGEPIAPLPGETPEELSRRVREAMMNLMQEDRGQE